MATNGSTTLHTCNPDGTINPDGLLAFAKQCVRLWGPDAAKRYLKITNNIFFERIIHDQQES